MDSNTSHTAADRTLVSVVILTRNRREEVLQALESCFGQTYRPLEVLVYDDASSDGTAAAVQSRFPDVQYYRSETNLGVVALRDRSLRDAAGRYLFSLDDDAYYSDPDTIAKTVRIFQDDAAVAAVAIPFVEPNKPHGRSGAQFHTRQSLRSFVGCAHALDREAALRAGGYRGFFFRQGEERDLCIRLLELGLKIVYGDSGPVVHLYSSAPCREVMSYYGIRNLLLYDYLNVPHPYAIPSMVYHSSLFFRYKLTSKGAVQKVWYILKGWCACAAYARHRRPVSRTTFRQMHALDCHGPEAATGTYAPIRASGDVSCAP